MTKELSRFPVEIGNMFQFYINLTASDFLIDMNFIRQGLSTNEEKYFNITGRNFVSYWHAPFHAINQEMIQYGRECGYTYVSYNLDSCDSLDKRSVCWRVSNRDKSSSCQQVRITTLVTNGSTMTLTLLSANCSVRDIHLRRLVI